MMMWLVIVCLASSVATSLECGQAPLDNTLESRVVGGHDATEGNFPFVAYIRDLGDNGSCSGSIVGSRHVLTAAHCVDDPNQPMPESIDPSRFQVHIGSVRKRAEAPRTVKKVFTGPQWARTSGQRGHTSKADDIAILELEAPIEFTDYAQPICLPRSFRERPGDPGYFVGWGIRNRVPEPYYREDYEWPDVANENILTFRKWSHCDDSTREDGNSPYLHREDYICIGQYMRLAHSGDSGGPLMVNRKGVWLQVGVYSSGRKVDGRGDEKFSRVTSYCKWIKNVTNGQVNCVKL